MYTIRQWSLQGYLCPIKKQRLSLASYSISTSIPAGGKPITRYYQNCYGLRTKLFTLNYNAYNLDYTFIILTKSWLHENNHDNELGLFNYNIFRFERCLSTSVCNRGGGVFIGIKKGITSSLLSVSSINVEHIFVELIVHASKYLIGGVYFLPNCPQDCYERYMSSVDSFLQRYPNHSYIFAGNFNLPNIIWSNDNSGVSYASNTILRTACAPESIAYF